MPNETNIPATPLTRLEQYWAGILDKIEGGGGNPNYVETIEGTLERPIPHDRYEEIRNDLENGNATMYISGNKTGLGPYTIYATPGRFSQIMAFFADVNSSYFVSGSFYFPDGEEELLDCYVIQYSFSTHEAVNLTGLFNPTDPVTTTIIHHPLPDTTP